MIFNSFIIIIIIIIIIIYFFFNSMNPYLLKTQVTVIPNFKNKEKLGGSTLVRGNQWKQLTETPQPWMEHGKKAMVKWLLGKNDLCYDLHRITKETNESNLQCYRVLSINTVILSPT